MTIPERTIKVLVNGAFGRMGQVTCQAIDAHPNLKLVGQTNREYDLKQAIYDSAADVVVDFTDPHAVYANTLTIIDAGAHPVIGTTGLLPPQIQALTEKCASLKRGGLIAPNFSIGAILLMKHAAAIAKHMSQVEIIEMHHDGKADSPSGTALNTAQLLKAANADLNGAQKPSRETLPHARGASADGIPIHAIRLPGFLAHEQVIFGAPGETLSLVHNTIDRQCFMPGVCFACEKVVALDQLVYGLDRLL